MFHVRKKSLHPEIRGRIYKYQQLFLPQEKNQLRVFLVHLSTLIQIPSRIPVLACVFSIMFVCLFVLSFG